MEEILLIIDNLPKIYNYIVPGYLYLQIYYFICSKKTDDYKYFIFKCIAISFLFNTLIDVIEKLLKIQLLPVEFSILETVIAVVTSFYLSRFNESVFFNDTLLQWMKIKKTASSNVWKDIFDFDKGMIVKVFISSEKITYQGKLVLVEDKEDNPEILITNYICRNYQGDLIYDFREENNRSVALNIKDVSRIEMVYSKNSVKI